ncbi:MAG: cell division topological specificity factor MinE [Clostridia bacterium]|nr:cell division topological specificity factor MinE [Clostridia bacterium]
MFENILKLFKKEENSKDLAKERLKLVLIHDKANVSPEFLEMVKGEIIKVIKKYMEIDEESLDIQLTKMQNDEGNRIVPALVANIPIINVKQIAGLAEKKIEEKVEEVAEAVVEKEEKPKTPKKAPAKKNNKKSK